MFKVIQKLAAFIVAMYHKEAARLHAEVAKVEQSIQDKLKASQKLVGEAEQLKQDLVGHQDKAVAATEQAVALDSLVGEKK